jgi:hypothetical protein
MPSMKRLEDNVYSLLFGRAPGDVMGLSERGRFIYRRQVRKSLKNGVLPAIPITQRLLGAEQVGALMDDWLAESPPTTRYYWQLPLQFADWLRHTEREGHPALPELIRWETVEVEVLNAPDADAWTHGDLSRDEVRVETHPSARLCVQRCPVHDMRPGDGWPEPLPAPAFVIAFRRGERFRFKIIDAQVAQLLALSSEGRTLGEAFGELDRAYGVVDRSWLRAELELLAAEGVLRAVPPDDVA